MAELFSELLEGKLDVPNSWCVSKVVVLFKKGDATLRPNYRPIAIIPLLCKLFCGVSTKNTAAFGKVVRA